LDRARRLGAHQHHAARAGARGDAKKNATPSAAIIDSQSVKGGQLPGASSGYDAGKKIKGRKRHTLTDTNGLLLGVVVTPASVQDRDGAKVLLCLFCHNLMGLLLIFADGGYAGKLEEFVTCMGRLFGLGAHFALGIVRKLGDQQGFVLLPRRWVIERSFGWLVKQRRLTRDHEKNPRQHEAFVYLAFIGIMTQRLAGETTEPRAPKLKPTLHEWIGQRQTPCN
jgi:transposase